MRKGNKEVVRKGRGKERYSECERRRGRREEEEGIERKKGNRAGKRRGKAFVTKAETGSG